VYPYSSEGIQDMDLGVSQPHHHSCSCPNADESVHCSSVSAERRGGAVSPLALTKRHFDSMLLRCARLLSVSVAVALFFGFAFEADASHSEAATRQSTSVVRSSQHQQPRRLVSGGTRTGGGKHPYLVVVSWLGNVTDPRVSIAVGVCCPNTRHSTASPSSPRTALSSFE
jgi:hypothetical protein